MPIYKNPITIVQGAPTPILPNEYQQIEYIQSTGTQWIDLGVIAMTDLVTVFDLEFTQISYQQPASVWRPSSNTVIYTGFVGGSPYLFGIRYGSTVRTSNISASANFRYKLKTVISRHSQKLYVNGEEIVSYSETIDINTGANLFLMCSNDSSETMPYAPVFAKWYKADVYLGNGNIINLIPCRRKADNIGGMFDIANNRFYTNAGTGEFLKGADV